MFVLRFKNINLLLMLLVLLFNTTPVPVAFAQEEEEADPAEIAIGERLFLETRFAQFFFVNSDGDANHVLTQGDPDLDVTITTGSPLPGPFAGQSMNCSACHLVDAQLEEAEGGMRTYADFARRSPIPLRPVSEGGDENTVTVRNSPALVNASIPRRGGFFFHFDAEFASMEDLVKGTLSGRNYGWLATESLIAISHVASIIRNDDGLGELAQEFGGSYRDVLRGNPRDGDGNLIEELILPENLQVDVDDPATTDELIFSIVSQIISEYVLNLAFSADEETGEFNLSPYDIFLQKNGLDRKPADGESELEYSQRLLGEVKGLSNPVFVQNGVDGTFQFHAQDFEFGPEELKGLKIFLTQPDNQDRRGLENHYWFGQGNRHRHGPRYQFSQGPYNYYWERPEKQHRRGPRKKSGVGNCISCHSAPNFTDFNFHNTGATQKEYDSVHRAGSFKRLRIPNYYRRLARHDKFLPATPQHPNASGKFRLIPNEENRNTDLGLWNVFGNPDFPGPQRRLWKLLCEKKVGQEFEFRNLHRNRWLARKVYRNCWNPKLLKSTIALFKTPGLRDLGHSAPYMHTGQEDTIEDVIEFYRDSSDLARQRKMRNPAPELRDIFLKERDVEPLARFLKSLNEDYE